MDQKVQKEGCLRKSKAVVLNLFGPMDHLFKQNNLWKCETVLHIDQWIMELSVDHYKFPEDHYW